MEHLTFYPTLPLTSVEFYIVTIRWNCLDETIPMNGHNIGIGWEIRMLAFEKVTTELNIGTVDIWSVWQDFNVCKVLWVWCHIRLMNCCGGK